LIYGYARVSTQEQELGTQAEALRKAGVDFIFEEKRSGSDTKRAELEKVLTLLGPGDTLVVYKLDRIARSLRHLLLILDRLGAQGAQFRSLTETIDTSTAAGRMMMQIVGAFAEFELEMIRERTRTGLHAAMRRGAKPGRPRAMQPAEEIEAVRLVMSGQATKSAVARRFGTHISSVKRAIHRANGQKEIFSDH
jgi:DNA invertase Pin-like site-specific DNA recombinase